jgi:hypothetical protein
MDYKTGVYMCNKHLEYYTGKNNSHHTHSIIWITRHAYTGVINTWNITQVRITHITLTVSYGLQDMRIQV